MFDCGVVSSFVPAAHLARFSSSSRPATANSAHLYSPSDSTNASIAQLQFRRFTSTMIRSRQECFPMCVGSESEKRKEEEEKKK